MLQAHYKDLHAVRPKCEKLEDHMTLGVSFSTPRKTCPGENVLKLRETQMVARQVGTNILEAIAQYRTKQTAVRNGEKPHKD